MNWEDFLKKFGTGYFDKTYLLCNANEGINEMELYFLQHLVHHKRNTALVVSNIDSLMAAEHMDFLKGRMDQATFDKRLSGSNKNSLKWMKYLSPTGQVTDTKEE